ncbi:MAG: hypothetical protein OER86_13790, partial [Phycisphaerae bacterium]|nr:hypothetical protein [Phycisphaerae bacterium]
MLRSVLCAVASALLLGGCAAPYINIPPLPGNIAWADPDATSVRAVESLALGHVIDRWPAPGGRYAIQLPEGTADMTYGWVGSRLSELVGSAPGSEPAEPAAEIGEDPVYEVVRLRIRGARATVDVIKPALEDERRLVTVYLAMKYRGWFVERGRLWQVPVDQALWTEPTPEPAPVPAPSPAPAPTAPDIYAP